MLTNIYLITTIFSWITILSFSAASISKLEKEGYKFRKQKNTPAELLFKFIKSSFMYFVPVANIFITLLILNKSDQVYTKIKEDFIKENKIYKKELDGIDNNYTGEATFQEKKAEDNKEYTPENQQQPVHEDIYSSILPESFNDFITPEMIDYMAQKNMTTSEMLDYLRQQEKIYKIQESADLMERIDSHIEECKNRPKEYSKGAPNNNK